MMIININKYKIFFKLGKLNNRREIGNDIFEILY